MKLIKHTYKDLVGKSEETRELCTPGCRQADKTTEDLKAIGRAIANQAKLRTGDRMF